MVQKQSSNLHFHSFLSFPLSLCVAAVLSIIIIIMASISCKLSLPIISSSSSPSNSNSSKKSSAKVTREDWRQRSKPIPPGGTYPAKDHCSQCGLCDTYYIAHVKNACAFLGDGMSKIEVGFFFFTTFL